MMNVQKEKYSLVKEIFTKDNSKEYKDMATELILLKTQLNMKGNGNMIIVLMENFTS